MTLVMDVREENRKNKEDVGKVFHLVVAIEIDVTSDVDDQSPSLRCSIDGVQFHR